MGTNKKEKAVFILGAGASYNYGFPLGKGLRHIIVRSYQGVINEIQRNIRNERPNFSSSSLSFIDKFYKSSDISIDLFLSKFPDFEIEGKIGIIYNILQSETSSKFLEELSEHKKSRKEENDDWMWHLYIKMINGLNVVQSFDVINFDHISFISFNYDRSLEYYLYISINNGFNFKSIGGNAKALMNRIRIEHVYGKVVDLPWEDNGANQSLEYKGFNVDNHKLIEWVDNIRVVYNRKAASMQNIHSIIREADNIFFLGFGYDQTNLNLIGIPEILNPDQKIYGTAIDNNEEEIAIIKNSLKQKNYKYEPEIVKSNCTELLRRFYHPIEFL